MKTANLNTGDVEQFIVKTKVCHDGFFQLKRHTVQYDQFNGNKSQVHNLEVLVREPTVAILLYDEAKHSILLTEQFRVGPLENRVNPWVYGLPAGIVDQGEDKQQAAVRETLEETGYCCTDLEQIGEFYLSPGGSNETTTLFFAKAQLKTLGLHGEMGENEDIKTHILSFDEAYELLQQGNLSVITGLAIT
jgi:ADP-ribose pyrophosphatase